MKTEMLLFIFAFVILITAYVYAHTRSKSENVFYAENKINKYLPSPFRVLVLFLGIILLVSMINNQTISFLLSFLWYLLFFLSDFYFISLKMLVIEGDKIRYPLHWKLRIEDLKEWHLDKGKRTVSFIDKNNKEYYFSSIKHSDMAEITSKVNNMITQLK